MIYVLYCEFILFNFIVNILKEFDSLIVEYFKMIKFEDLGEFIYMLNNV